MAWRRICPAPRHRSPRSETPRTQGSAMSQPDDQPPAEQTRHESMLEILDALKSPTASAEDEERLQEIIEKEEKSTRSLNRFWHGVFATLGVSMSLFYIYTAGTLPAPVQWQRGIYVMLTYIMILILYPLVPAKSRFGRWLAAGDDDEHSAWRRWLRRILMPKSGPGVVGLTLIGLTLIAVGYYINQFAALQKRAGAYNESDYMIAVLGLIVSLEVCRRVLGWSMTIIGIVFLLYLRFGYVFYDVPLLEAFAHRGRTMQRTATTI